MLDLILISVGGGVCILSLILGFYFVAKGLICKTNQGKYMSIAAISMTIYKFLEIIVLK